MECSSDLGNFFPLSSATSPSILHKKWRIAVNTIYACRVISFAKNPVIVSVVIDAHQPLPPPPFDQEKFQRVNKKSLAEVAKDKKWNLLRQELGGIEGVLDSLQTYRDFGINGGNEELEIRREVLGSNTYTRPKKKSFFKHVLEALNDKIILILIGCAVLSLGFGIKEHGLKNGWYDGGSIIVAVILVVVVSAVSNFRQANQFHKLSEKKENINVEVIRSGHRKKISIFDLVTGDVVCLSTGDQIPGDGLFLDGYSLEVDESSLTGESEHVNIDIRNQPFLLSGTKVVDGYGRMVITAVGRNTMWGEMMSSISREIKEETPLQARLNKLTSYIGKIGVTVAFLVLTVLIARYFSGKTRDSKGKTFVRGVTGARDITSMVVSIITTAITIIVVAIPEGLPLAVTLTLAYSMKRMMSDHAMVRKLSACETMGSATTICTDKTGTLTTNRMEVTTLSIGNDIVKEDVMKKIDANVIQLMQQAVGLNTTGFVKPSVHNDDMELSGSPTERAILHWAATKLDMQMEKLNREYSICDVEAFNSEKKRSGVLIRKNNEKGVIYIHWKGAAEMILGMSSHYHKIDGTREEINEETRKKFGELIEGMAAGSLRCIAFAYKKTTEKEKTKKNGEGEAKILEDKGLTLLGIIGLKDPCRPGVKKAVEECKKAGVQVKMITGDNVFTAKAIATECGILRADQNLSLSIIEGETFRNFAMEERMKRIDNIYVMARSSPMDKLLMVQCLKMKGHVVAVTGDGTNDAPALREADIGLSMGIQGTEVAKESSDIIILDDDFSTVVTVLRWGRSVFNNIQKFIQFQLTVNVAALVINFIAAMSSGDVPLTTVQLLWVNLIMDTLGALALATDRPTNELMKKPPVGRTEPLITNFMWRNLLSQALYQIAVLLILQFKGRDIFDVEDKINKTIIFNTFVFCQIFNEFNARKMESHNIFEGILKNKLFLGIITVTVIMQAVMVEFLRKFAKTERLNWMQWGVCIAIGAVSWPIDWLVKFIPVPDEPFFNLVQNWTNPRSR